MLIGFFQDLRRAGVPTTLTEFLALLQGLEQRVVAWDVEQFYYLARTALVKDERHFDRFDRAFEAHFRGITDRFDELLVQIPEDFLKSRGPREFSEEERQQIEALGGWDKLMETLRQRLKEQRKRHEGGNRWIGTRGSSPFGADGFNPEGIRIGQAGGRQRSAVKIWERREFRDLDDSVELGTRNLKVGLRKLRRFAREGAAEHLDLDDTIRATARNGGMLDVRWVPERHNAVKVLLFLDVGGSMDEHVRQCEELFSAARSEFRHLQHFYFHNCVYERVWTDNRRGPGDFRSTVEVMRTYGRDYKLILVGDASMSPYEILYPGGSIEHVNDEAGLVWMRRLLSAYPSAIWLNPEQQQYWDYTASIGLLREVMEDRMYPLTLDGLDRGIRELH